MEIKVGPEFEKAIKDILITFINRYEAGKELPEIQQADDGADAFNEAFTAILKAIKDLNGD